MIYYKTNQNWFGDVRHLATSWTMVRIVRSVIGIGLYATVLCVVMDYFNWEREINMNTGVFSLLGVMLSILLVFRTNSAYDRWWEGRKQWGALVNNSRNLAIYIETMFPKEDREVRHFMAVRIANFCISLVEHLRNGVNLDKLIFLSKTERATYEAKDHIPNQIALEIFDRIAESRRRGDLSEGDYINIKAQQESLLRYPGRLRTHQKNADSVFLRRVPENFHFGLCADAAFRTVDHVPLFHHPAVHAAVLRPARRGIARRRNRRSVRPRLQRPANGRHRAYHQKKCV